MGTKIALREIGAEEVVIHAASGAGSYATLCGCSDDDDQFEAVTTPGRAKIDCGMCLLIWKDASTFRKAEFRSEGNHP